MGFNLTKLHHIHISIIIKKRELSGFKTDTIRILHTVYSIATKQDYQTFFVTGQFGPIEAIEPRPGKDDEYLEKLVRYLNLVGRK